MVERVLAGESARSVARAMRCSPSTVTTARDRWQQATDSGRASGAWCAPRRPVVVSVGALRGRRAAHPRCPRADQLGADAAGGAGRPSPRDRLWRAPRRHGVSRRRRDTRQTYKRFEWSQPGALLHIDAYKAPKFLAPGHRVTGDRDQIGRARGRCHTVVIAVQDDHTRLVYAELHSAENAANVSITLRRGAVWMCEQGLGPVEAVLSDNAKCYTGHHFAQALAELDARHIRIPPYTPRWNGRLERFFGTLEDEWAHGRVWPNSATRDRALASFIRYFNRWRPHSAAGGRPPITRVQQDRKQDS